MIARQRQQNLSVDRGVEHAGDGCADDEIKSNVEKIERGAADCADDLPTEIFLRMQFIVQVNDLLCWKDWENDIPFIGWTIIPYWSINAFYGLSVFVCRTNDELDTIGRRLLTAQVIAVTCFILFPLRFTFAPPETAGVSGFLFATLASFDLPFNQAPSLHIALLVMLWVHYTRIVPRWSLWLLHPWYVLVGGSVLTTYQHHFIDIPTGALLGFMCLWIWPDRRPVRRTGAPRGRRCARPAVGGARSAACACRFRARPSD